MSPRAAPALCYLSPESLPGCGLGPQRFSPQPAPPTAAGQHGELPAELELLPRSHFFLFTGSRALPRHEPSARLTRPQRAFGATRPHCSPRGLDQTLQGHKAAPSLAPVQVCYAEVCELAYHLLGFPQPRLTGRPSVPLAPYLCSL